MKGDCVTMNLPMTLKIASLYAKRLVMVMFLILASYLLFTKETMLLKSLAAFSFASFAYLLIFSFVKKSKNF